MLYLHSTINKSERVLFQRQLAFNLMQWVTIFIFLVLPASKLLADTITGTIEFTKKPPHAGVLYATDDGAGMSQGIVDQLNQQFSPMLIVTKKNETIIFKNSDEVDHNIFANDRKSNVKFDVGLMPPGDNREFPQQWPADSLSKISCKIHPKMRGYIAAISSSAVQQFEFDRSNSSFAIDLQRVPSDANEIRLLLPKYDAIVLPIAKGETKTADLVRKGKNKGKLTLIRN